MIEGKRYKYMTHKVSDGVFLKFPLHSSAMFINYEDMNDKERKSFFKYSKQGIDNISSTIITGNGVDKVILDKDKKYLMKKINNIQVWIAISNQSLSPIIPENSEEYLLLEIPENKFETIWTTSDTYRYGSFEIKG